jgi:hypothetical protein
VDSGVNGSKCISSVARRSSTGWTQPGAGNHNRAMGRYRHQVYEKASTPRWVTVFGLQWQVIESHRLEPASDLSGAMASALERLAVDGWQIESEPRFGFAFIRREGERRLLILTPKDPHDHAPQSFSPFK